MITVEFKRNKNNEIISFVLNGHGWYDVQGKDMVCAAGSAATDMALIGLAEKLKLNLDFEKNDGGYLKVVLPENIGSDDMAMAQFLLELLFTEYLDIESNYGKYILVKER